MKAAVLRNARIAVEDVPEPQPQPGMMMVRPLACGICGSDLHARDHAPHLCGLLHRAGFRGFMDPARPVVMGHEFCCEVLEKAGDFRSGDRVVALPFLTGPTGVELLGYSNSFYGGFAERMLLQPEASFRVPDDVPTPVAALTEPLSVAVHAVAQAQPGPDDAFAVIGCGPVGLFVIARLRALGLAPILAIEPDPVRRAMAERMGADLAVAPGPEGAAWWNDLDLPLGLSDAMAIDPAVRRKSRAVLFECVGKPGMLMRIATDAPVGAVIVVIGTCMESDAIEPAFLIQKGLRLQFVFAYDAAEFADAFAMICADPDALAPMVTGQTRLSGVNDAFDTLIGGGAIKLMVTPSLSP
ncbi:zinc-binding dehydrogenase [Sphingomonas sp. SUN019]|uniref:alcohol dehydrogenase catalytic domain-containing protein n=1 Tax=Sphingomonas sp. SUN019 TaxID=2937788 RepID=UPI002164535D|nr:zinc-binding dehydrogenase [Sphingomonas sp. SUN019]UVO51980.1 zinc-binding dehydrogenase [Sphingomonas sp. SUN019]